jgi:D-alanyl-D-alanine carboxypeptidase (penicillin-binding protein 5/6)
MTKKWQIIVLVSLLLLILFPVELEAKEPAIRAKAAVLLDGSTGRILFEKNAGLRLPPASTTKVLTAILALEKGEPGKSINVSSHAAAVGEATLGLSTGDQLSFQDLLHGALLKSANDACVALAEAVAPSEEEFVGLMNLKAWSLGAGDSRFYNTNGLPHEGHLTTAYDLALITRYALRNPTFAEIVKKKYYTVTWQDKSWKRKIKNTNLLLWSYPKTTGVKTGTTNKAGKCLIASAREGTRELIAVVLNSPDRYQEARGLLEYGFQMKERENAE